MHKTELEEIKKEFELFLSKHKKQPGFLTSIVESYLEMLNENAWYNNTKVIENGLKSFRQNTKNPYRFIQSDEKQQKDFNQLQKKLSPKFQKLNESWEVDLKVDENLPAFRLWRGDESKQIKNTPASLFKDLERGTFLNGKDFSNLDKEQRTNRHYMRELEKMLNFSNSQLSEQDKLIKMIDTLIKTISDNFQSNSLELKELVKGLIAKTLSAQFVSVDNLDDLSSQLEETLDKARILLLRDVSKKGRINIFDYAEELEEKLEKTILEPFKEIINTRKEFAKQHPDQEALRTYVLGIAGQYFQNNFFEMFFHGTLDDTPAPAVTINGKGIVAFPNADSKKKQL